MMKKALLALILLIMVVAVSYMKAVRQGEKVDKSFQLGQKAGQSQVLVLKSANDSLKTNLGEQEVAHAEALLSRDKESHNRIDSLKEVIEVKNGDITELKKKKVNAQKVSDSGERHKQLLAYYKKQYESLPGELTDYEFKAAVSEIRQETANRFSISVAELNRLREKYKVNF